MVMIKRICIVHFTCKQIQIKKQQLQNKSKDKN